jgi:ubiquinone/menaquinone biosynthesis C-methylase UbiE
MKIILDLCGGSGAWSLFYKNAGYNVILITLPDFDIRNYKIEDGYLVFTGEQLKQLFKEYFPIKEKQGEI